MSTLASMPTQPAGPIRIPWPLYRMTPGAIRVADRLRLLRQAGRRPPHQRIRGEPNGRIALARQPSRSGPDRHRGDPAGRGRLAYPQREGGADSLADQHPAPRPGRRARRLPRDYLTHYPDAADVALVAEVSVSSLDKDRAMADIYAAGGDPGLLDRQRGRRPGRGLLRPGSIRLSVARGPGARPCAARRHRRRRHRRDPGGRHPALTGVTHAQADPQATACRGGPGGGRGPVPGRRDGHGPA